MKILRLLAVALSLFAAQSAFATAFTASCVWSGMGAGNANYGSMFDPSQTAGMATDLASTSSSATNPNFSSATYGNFTNASLVGDWVFVGAGAGWQTGFYKITAVGSNVITVDAAIGHVVTYNTATGAFGLSTVAGCGATAGGTWAINYSGPGQSADFVTNATFACAQSVATMTDSSNTFDVSMVGNAIHITSVGTNMIIGWYTITAYANAQSVTINTPAATAGAGSGATGFIGGAIALVDNINSAGAGLGPVAGNIIWLSGTFTQGANVAWLPAGTATSPIKTAGYATYWGDGYLGRTNGSGALTTTNMATMNFSASHTFVSTTGTFNLFENLNISGNAASAMAWGGTGCAFTRCTLTNADANAASITCELGAGAIAFNCDIIESGATLATQGVFSSSAASRLIGSRVTMSSTNAASYGLTYSSSFVAIGNQFFGAGGIGIFSGNTGANGTIFGNTIVGFVDDINIITGSTILQCVVDNMLTDCTGFPLNNVSSGNATFTAYNRYRQNTSGGTNAIGTGGTWAAYTNYAPVITGLSATDYTSVSSDLRLVGASPAVGAGWFPLASIGAIQLSQVQSSSGASTKQTILLPGASCYVQ